MIHHHFQNKSDLANLKSDVDRLDIDKLYNVSTNLSDLKGKVDELDVDKLVPASLDLSKQSDVVKRMLLKTNVYNVKIRNIEDKITGITKLATNAFLNAKTNEFEGEIPSIANLAATATLTTVENKIPNVNDLFKKADCDAKISDIEHKYFTTSVKISSRVIPLMQRQIKKS